jgi:hypothetical protein
LQRQTDRGGALCDNDHAFPLKPPPQQATARKMTARTCRPSGVGISA